MPDPTSPPSQPPEATGIDQHRDGERGSITLLAVVLAFICLALVGMVLDGGAKLRAGREAADVAQEAARAGAGQIDRDRAYAHGTFTIDRAAAIRAAQNYLTAAGHTGTVTPLSPTKIEVSVTVSKPTTMLSLIGIGSMTVTSSATADLLTGVNGPGR